MKPGKKAAAPQGRGPEKRVAARAAAGKAGAGEARAGDAGAGGAREGGVAARVDAVAGRVAVAFAAAPPAGGSRHALVLDGVIHDVAAAAAVEGAWRLGFALPRNLACGLIDVVSLPDGASVIGAPLVPGGGVRLGSVTLDGLRLSGWFSAPPYLDAALGIGFVPGPGGPVVAQGVAMREDGAGDAPAVVRGIAASAAAGGAAAEPREGGGAPREAVATPVEAVWRFSVCLLTLPRPGQVWSLLARIGGHLVAAPAVSVSGAEIGLIGCVDAVSPEHVEGWAADLKRPKRRVRLEVLLDGAVVGRVTAEAPRPDVQSFGVGDGACGFSLALPKLVDREAKRHVAVRLAGTCLQLAGSPVVVDPVPGLMGCFDSLHGMSAHGWALNVKSPEKKISVEVVGPGGEVLGAGEASQFRGDLLDAGLADGHCAFKIDLSAHFDALMDRDVIVRVAGTNQLLAGSPQRVSANRNILKFLQRRRALTPASAPRLRRALNYRAGTLGISFIMPVFETKRAWLVEALESVRTQYCDAWELICVDDGSRAPHVAEVLRSYAARDSRIRVLTSTENVGIARAVNFGLRAARHDYVAFIDHDDRVEPDAAWQLIRAIKATGADLLYTDEAQTSENTEAITELRLRPAFSHDYYLSHPYFVHIVCARTEIARRLGGWDEGMAISADVDFVLRMIEASEKITHVPAVLYRWRTHGGSTGHAKQAEVMAATTGALQRHLDRLGAGGRVREGVWYNQFRVDWPASDGRVLIVIPTKNKADLLKVAIDSIERHAAGVDYRIVVIDHQSDEAESRAYLKSLAGRHVVMPYKGAFNFSRMNNRAVAEHGADAEFVLFLNNDVEATQDGFLDRMRRLANRADVGAVGALLLYADKTVQHAGVIIGFNESAEHALKFQPCWIDKKGRRNLGYNCALYSTRDYSAVTAACLMMRRSVFEEVGGFDESFGIGFNDTDLCLRVGAAGYKILYDGSTILYHYESATRSQTKQVFHPEDTKRMLERWDALLKAGDPWYNPHLSLRTQDHVPAEGVACRATQKPRAFTREKALAGAARK